MNPTHEDIVTQLLSKSLPEALTELTSSDLAIVTSYFSGGELMVDYPWVEAKAGLVLTHEKEPVNQFFEEFEKIEAKKYRRKCCIGTKRSNRLTELDLLANIQQLQQHEKTTGSIDVELSSRIGLRISDLVKNGNSKPICKLCEIIKSKEQFTPVSTAAYLNEKIWREFCIYFLAHQKLPTKKELREACNVMGDDSDQKRSYTRELKKLGLSGLPEHK